MIINVINATHMLRVSFAVCSRTYYDAWISARDAQGWLIDAKFRAVLRACFVLIARSVATVNTRRLMLRNLAPFCLLFCVLYFSMTYYGITSRAGERRTSSCSVRVSTCRKSWNFRPLMKIFRCLSRLLIGCSRPLINTCCLGRIFVVTRKSVWVSAPRQSSQEPICWIEKPGRRTTTRNESPGIHT